jgi:hypothetical protein
MMQQMQTGESSIAPDSQSKEAQSEETEDENIADNEQETKQDQTDDVSEEIDYETVVDGTIAEAKEKLEDAEEVDYDELLKAERENKDRKTLKEWAEAQKG